MRNGWTGGQYSLYRYLLGGYLFFYFTHLIPWGKELFSDRGALAQASARHQAAWFPNLLALGVSPAAVTCFLLTGALLGLLLMLGLRDRWASLGLWYLWACMLDRNPLTANPHLAFIGWILLAHACLPEAPYGSWDARRREDGNASWEFPPAIYGAAWLVFSWSYTYSGYLKLFTPSWREGTALSWVLQNPLCRDPSLARALLSWPAPFWAALTFGVLGLEFLYGPLAFFKRLRPWLWVSMFLMHLSILLLLDLTELTLGMILAQLLLFDPAWIKPKEVAGIPFLFYDGHCGLCHRTVRFVLAEDRHQRAFHFSPLQGELIQSSLPSGIRSRLPDSLVVLLPGGELYTRSDAVLYILETLGGLWRLLAFLGKCIPRPLRNGLYDGVARVRHYLFKKPQGLCPLVPAEWRDRFEN